MSGESIDILNYIKKTSESYEAWLGDWLGTGELGIKAVF